MEVNGGADIHLQSMEDPMLEQVDVPCREEPTLEQVSWQELQPTRDPRWSRPFLKDCILWKGLTLERFVKHCLP
ncbi:EH domain-containing protein 4 [Grus japonensis]|uniref:EH domain-containing protein 4 n=1 Tax=Grus japonensis TaxID=30415 RepID=A0ABC9W7L1_GRUJA